MQTDSQGGPKPWSFLDWCLGGFAAHPKSVVASAAMLLGGTVILAHFYAIGYLPVLNISELLGVVIASAAIGAISIGGVALLLIFPGMILAYWRRCGLGPKTIVQVDGASPIRWKHSAYAKITAAAAFFAVPVVAWIVLKTQCYAALFVGILPALFVGIVIETSYRDRWVVQPLRSAIWLFLFQLLFYMVIWSFSLFLVLLWTGMSEGRVLLNFALLVVITIFLHTSLLTEGRQPIGYRGAILLLPILYFLIATGTLLSGPEQLMRFFRLGQIPSVDLALSKTGCDAVNAVWSKRPCVATTGGQPSAFLLPKVDLVTRIGPYYIVGEQGVVANLDNRRLIRIALRSEDVLSWSTSEDMRTP